MTDNPFSRDRRGEGFYVYDSDGFTRGKEVDFNITAVVAPWIDFFVDDPGYEYFRSLFDDTDEVHYGYQKYNDKIVIRMYTLPISYIKEACELITPYESQVIPDNYIQLEKEYLIEQRKIMIECVKKLCQL